MAEVPDVEHDAGVSHDASRGARTLWVWISTLVCCAAMGAVVTMALRGRDAPARLARPDRPAGPRTLGPFVPPPGPQNPCGPVDPDRPAAIEVLGTAANGGIDFGDVGQVAPTEDTADTREIVFRSRGPGPLCVYRVKSGCGCFHVKRKEPNKKRFEPGEKGVLLVTLDTSGKVGRITKDIALYTNSMESPVARIACTANVRLGLMANRRTMAFRSVPIKTPSTATVLLHAPKTDPAWTVTRVVGTKEQDDGTLVPYTFRVAEMADPRFVKRAVTVTHPGMDKVGRWQDQLLVHTTHPGRPHVALQLHMTVVNRILTGARQVILGHVKPGSPSKPAVVRFRPGDASVQFTLTRAYVVPLDARPGRPTGFLAAVDEDEKGWLVRVTYDGRDRPPGLLEGELVVANIGSTAARNSPAGSRHAHGIAKSHRYDFAYVRHHRLHGWFPSAARSHPRHPIALLSGLRLGGRGDPRRRAVPSH